MTADYILEEVENERDSCVRKLTRLQADYNVLYDQNKALVEENQKLRDANANSIRFAKIAAATLASAGGYDHKTKNEVLLRVVSGLLNYASPELAEVMENGVPF